MLSIYFIKTNLQSHRTRAPIINSNKQLIQIFEQKIKDEINKLWQSEVSDTFEVSDTYTKDVPLSLVAEE